MSPIPWQLQIAEKSLKKKEKIRLIEREISVRPSDVLLDLGCAQGILSYFLREKGGFWVSTDLDFENLKTSRELLGGNIVQMTEEALPFRDRSFDTVVCLDYLEHVDDDLGTLREIRRVLREGGGLVLVTPHVGTMFVVQRIRLLLGLKLEFYGHKRAGYRLNDLEGKLSAAGFRPLRHKTFSRFFTEFLELALNVVYVHTLSSRPTSPLRDGHIRPSTPDEFAGRRRAFNLYKLVYPIVWLISRLDTLLFFQRGNGVIIWAEKGPGGAGPERPPARLN
jgi:SAM-dependent methyltransferase